jgi:hypothetical protein
MKTTNSFLASKQKDEYARRFIDYEGMMNPGIIQSQEHLQMNQQSVSSLYSKKNLSHQLLNNQLRQ